MTIIGELFDILTSIITGLFTAISDALVGVTKIFYVDETGFTVLGSLLLIGFGLFFVMFAWRVIQGLIKR